MEREPLGGASAPEGLPEGLAHKCAGVPLHEGPEDDLFSFGLHLPISELPWRTFSICPLLSYQISVIGQSQVLRFREKSSSAMQSTRPGIVRQPNLPGPEKFLSGSERFEYEDYS